MRLLYLAVTLAAVSTGSFWALTEGPLAPAAEAGVSVPEPGDSAPRTTVDVVREPPAETSRAARLALDPSEGVRVNYTASSYAVEGRTEREILQSLLQRGPVSEGARFFGLTSVEISLFYRPTVVASDCVIGEVGVALDVNVTLPEWMAPAEPADGLVRDWATFRRALGAHEARHREIAEDGAAALYRQLAGLRRATCEEVEAEAQRRLERSEVAIESAHRRYDSETGHGQTEGAIWPLLEQ